MSGRTIAQMALVTMGTMFVISALRTRVPVVAQVFA